MAVTAPALSSTGGARAEGAPLTSLVSILQLSDSAFPSGRYTLSYGLETLVQEGHLTVPASNSTLFALLDDSIRFGVAPSDGVALACAHRASAPYRGADLELLTEIDQRLTAVKLPREVREASIRTGRAVLATVTVAIGGETLRAYAEHVKRGHSPGNHAVVIGVLSAHLGVPCPQAAAGELYAFSSGWVAAAIRLGVVDHRAAQGLLHQLRPVIADAAADVAERDVTEISSCTPLLDVISMRHEQAELRLFAT